MTGQLTCHRQKPIANSISAKCQNRGEFWRSRQPRPCVEGLAKVDVHALVESELEARFIKALRRVEVDGEKPRVRQDLVRGKPGYLVRVGSAS